MLKLSNRKIYSLLALLFLINGAYFFFHPDLVHTTHVFKFVKYLLFAIFMALTINYKTANKLVYCALLIPLALYYFLVNSAADIIFFINYCLPLEVGYKMDPLCFFCFRFLRDSVSREPLLYVQ